MFRNSPSSKFDAFPAERLPTPPREITQGIEDALRFLQEGHDENEPDVTSTTTTKPLQSIPAIPSPTRSPLGASGTTKKVFFSVQPTYHNLPQTGLLSSPGGRGVLRSTPTSSHSKPLRSILKPSHGQPPLSPDDLDRALASFSPQEPGSFRNMLNSVLQHLGRPARSARLDAYLALNGALKTYEGIPDPDAIIDKRNLLTQFIARDVAWKDSNGRLDRDIVVQALQLANTIMFSARAATILDEEFRSFILERAVMTLEQPDAIKAILKTYMVLLCQPRLYVSVLTASRADKIVTALQTLQDRYSGNSLIPARLIIFHRLLEQAPATMLTRMRDWIELVLHGLLSSLKEVRFRARECFTTAALNLGTYQQASKLLQELLERECELEGGQDGKQTYGEFFNGKLLEMIESPELSTHAPQVWAAVVLMLRSRRRPIDKWPPIYAWLKTIQRCLNSGDAAVVQHAHIAWNKLVYAIMPDSSTTEKFRSILRIPIFTELKIRGRDKHSHIKRALALDSYSNLLHYALRPELSHDDIDKAWCMYVDEGLAVISSSGPQGQRNACRALQGLLQKRDGVWNANAANELKAIELEELPRLDPRWIRSRFSRVLRVIEPILINTMDARTEVGAAADHVWQLLFASLAEAGSQEVKTSNELKDTIAQLVNFLRRLWSFSSRVDQADNASLWLKRYQFFVETAVDSLGASHFVQEFLHVTNTNEVEASITPSNRLSKHHSAHSAFASLLAIYSQATPLLRSSELFESSILGLLQRISGAKSPIPLQISSLHSALLFCRQTSLPSWSEQNFAAVWRAVAAYGTDVLNSVEAVTPQRDVNGYSAAIRSTLQIIQLGVLSDSYSKGTENLDAAVTLYAALSKSAMHVVGESGIMSGIAEPFAKLLLESCEACLPTALKLGTVILESSKWPQERQLPDGSRPHWSTSLGVNRTTTSSSSEFPEHLCSLIVKLMQRAYEESCLSEQTDVILKEITIFLRSSPNKSLSAALKRLQTGLVFWIEDKMGIVFSAHGSKNAAVATIQSGLIGYWTQTLQLIGKLNQDSALLCALEPLLVAGLSSPCLEIVNATIAFWNTTFGGKESLQYPSNLEAVLYTRSLQTDIALPGFTEDSDQIALVSLPPLESAATSDCAETHAPAEPTPTSLRKPTIEVNSLEQRVVEPKQVDVASNNMLRNRIPKIRHDDSQVEFTAIETALDSHESELLTENQQEVRDRQQSAAQMFPEMSSSPVGSSRRARSMMKKLDLVGEVKQLQNPELFETPDLTEAGPMSDDLPSSPTPRTRRCVDEPTLQLDAEEDREPETDLPSSPPRQEREPVHDQAIEALENLDEPNDQTVGVLQSEGQQPEAIEQPSSEDSAEQPSQVGISQSVASEGANLQQHPDNVAERRRSSRKRKRSSRASFTTRKRKNQSSVNQSILGQSQNDEAEQSEAEQEDIGDEIVVAGSQAPADSTVSASSDVEDPSIDIIKSSIEDENERNNVQEKEMRSAPRRGANAIAAHPPRGVKRSASEISAGAADGQVPPFDSQAHYREARSTRSSRRAAAMAAAASKSAEVLTEESIQVEAVLLDHSAEQADIGRRASNEPRNDQGAVPKQKPRKIIQPRSLLARLRGMLSECKNMILGSQDEREFDDVLFEMRREIHEAGRRGREAQENDDESQGDM